jgi:hypothetical protein
MNDDVTRKVQEALIGRLSEAFPGIPIYTGGTTGMSERDTHFLNAAKLLYEKLAQNVVSSDKGLSDVEAFKQEQHTIIAQFAYDLVAHAIDSSSDWVPLDWTVAETISQIPDLTSWPEQT